MALIKEWHIFYYGYNRWNYKLNTYNIKHFSNVSFLIKFTYFWMIVVAIQRKMINKYFKYLVQHKVFFLGMPQTHPRMLGFSNFRPIFVRPIFVRGSANFFKLLNPKPFNHNIVCDTNIIISNELSIECDQNGFWREEDEICILLL